MSARAGEPKRSASPRPEHWSARAATRDVVRLEVPADPDRSRRFEISVRLRVRNRAGRSGASHALHVQVDGALEWSRSAPTAPDGDEDGLELRIARTVAVGRPLRLLASCELHGVERLALSIDAEEID